MIMRQAIIDSTTSESDLWIEENVRKSQMRDPHIKRILEFIEAATGTPSYQDFASCGPVTKRYWLFSPLYVKNGVLYRQWEPDDGKVKRWQLLLPRSRVIEVLKELYSSSTGGHFGVTKTLDKVRERFFWNK